MLVTPWGYTLTALTEYPSLVSVTEFNTATANKYAGDARVEPALKVASSAIRNYCGWHVCPSMKCQAYPVGGGIVTKLPAAYVSAISGITEDGTELTAGTDYEWRRDGLLKRKRPRRWSDSWDGIVVEYTAGYSAEAVPDLAEAVCAIAAGVLAVSPGVTSESADGVSISFSANAASIAASLTSQQKKALEPYKVVNSHAA